MPALTGPRATAALALLVAVAAIGSAQGPDRLDERDTSCWPCHVAWPAAPLQSLYDVVPPEQAGGTEVFDYTVQIRNPWLHEIIRIEPSLDITQAPSLAFFDDRPPIDLDVIGTIDAEPTGLVDPVAQQVREPAGHVVIEVPEGATDLAIEIEPMGSVAPRDLVLRLYPGQTEPEGAPAIVRDEAGPDGTESWAPSPEEPLAAYGTGNWTVEAVLKSLRQDGSGSVPAGEVDFQVRAQIDFSASEEKVQFLTRTTTIGPGQSELVTWTLRPVGVPGPGEQVTLQVDAEVYFDHKPSSAADDFANVTKSLEVDVVDEGGEVLLVSGEAGAPRPQNNVAIGVTMTTISEAVGYASSFLLIASVYAGGMFGKASRRQLNKVFGSAKRRVAFHNFLSYGLTLAAAVHTVLFIVETKYHWTLGLIWGGLALLAMLLLGVTGALQVPMIRRWNYGLWRWTHLVLAIASLVFTVVHFLLDGAHFGAVQEYLGWSDPLDDRGLLTR